MKCSLFLSSVILFLLLQIYYKAWYFCWNYPFFLSTRALYFCNFLVHCRVLNSQLWSFNQNFHCFKGVVQCQISFLWHFLVSSYKWYSSKICNRKYAFFYSSSFLSVLWFSLPSSLLKSKSIYITYFLGHF